jgi:hypothetical protein
MLVENVEHGFVVRDWSRVALDVTYVRNVGRGFYCQFWQRVE